MKGRTYEEIYGPAKAAELRAIRVITGAKPKSTKGKTYQEIYGKWENAWWKENAHSFAFA